MVKNDKITLDRIALLHPKIRENVKVAYLEACEALSGRAMLRLAYTLRTNKEQDDLFAIGRTKPGKKVTNAKGGESYHNYALAWDIVLLVDKDNNGTFESASWETNVDFDGDGIADWQEVVQIFKKIGAEWGGDWKFTDMPHFQITFGKSIADLKELFRTSKFIPNTNYISL